MEGLNLLHFLINLRNQELFLKKPQKNELDNKFPLNNNLNNNKPTIQKPDNNIQIENLTNLNNINMNKIQNTDRAIFIRTLLKLPENLFETLKFAQSKNPILNNNITQNNNTLVLNGLNESILKNNTVLSQIFSEVDNVNDNKIINELLQNTQILQILSNIKNIPQGNDYVMKFFGAMISLPALQNMVIQNSKEAVSKLIIAMSNASKIGLNNDPIRETLSVLNSCVALAESGDTVQTLKSILLLYLPWLPLNEDVGFDLEITAQPDEENANLSKLVVLIQTKNFGNVRGELTLTTSNSLNIFITCSEEFPKKTLLENLNKETSTFSMTTNIDIEAVQNKNKDSEKNRETKVNLSSTNEINPYLLLMAHAFIRETIALDSSMFII